MLVRMSAFKVILIVSFLISTQCAPMSKQKGQEFLKKFGYMSNETSGDEEYRKSLEKFQKTFSLPATGQMNSETAQQIERPRCGRADGQEIINKNRIWNKQKLTYKFINYPRNGLGSTVTREEIKKAFKLWSEYVPIEFEEKPEGSEVDIDITFDATADGDGPGKTLAYAYFPRVGNIHFDNEEWTSNPKKDFYLLSTAGHEIGHSIGLKHSMNKNSLMYPYIQPYNTSFWLLHHNDISRIQNLYGKRENEVNTAINICDAQKIDSVFFKDDSVYIIVGKNVWKMNKNRQFYSGYPKEVSEAWKGAPSTVDAVYNYKDSIYFHQGTNVWMYDGKMKKTNSDKKIITNINAGLTYEYRTYIFKGSQYYRYDNMNKMPGYPKDISSYWTSVPNDIDAVYYEDTEPYKYFYFFKGDKVFKFNMDNRVMIKEMPLREYLSC